MVFIVTKAALAATIVGVGVTFGALSYLARRGQENNENGLLTSKFNKFNPNGSSSLGKGFPSISLFTTSSENERPPGSSLQGSSPLFSFPSGFRLFGGGGSSTISSLFLRDCNCKLIHECSTFYGGASQSFRFRRTCGFEGFQRKICCDEGPFFSTPPPNLALDEVKSAHAHLNSNSKELPCAHKHDANGGIRGCNCDHFQQDANDAGNNKDANTASVDGSGSDIITGQGVTTTRRPSKINIPSINEYFRDDPPVDSKDSTPQAFPFEAVLFPNEGNNDEFNSKGRNDRIDAAFGKDVETTTGTGILMKNGTVFPSLSNFFPEDKFPQIDVRTSLTTQTEVSATDTTIKSSQDTEETSPKNDNVLPVSTTETTGQNEGHQIDDISATQNIPKPIKLDAIDITEAPESTTVKKDLQTSTLAPNEQLSDVTEDILLVHNGSGTLSPQSLELDHSLVNSNDESSTVPYFIESAQPGISSQGDLTTTAKVKEYGVDSLSSTVSTDRRPFALTGASNNINDFNEKVTTLYSIPEGDGDNDKGSSTTLSSSQSETVPSQVSTTLANDAMISDDTTQTSAISSSSVTEDQNDEIIQTTVKSLHDDDVDVSKSTSENMGQIDTVTTMKPDISYTNSNDNDTPEIEEVTTSGVTTPLSSQDHLVSSTISSDISIPATTEKGDALDQFDDEQRATTTPARTSLSPIDSQTSSPIDSQTSSPIDSQTSSPIDSQTSSPIDSQTSSPIDSQTSSPIDSQTSSPIDSQTLSPIDSQTLSPIDSDDSSTVLSSKDHLVSSTISSEIPIPATTEKEDFLDKFDDEQRATTMPAQTSLSLVDSQTLSPIDSDDSSTVLTSQDHLISSTISSDISIPMTTEKEDATDQLDDGQLTTTMPPLTSLSPIDSQTSSTIDSQTTSPIDSQTSSLIDSQTFSPINSQFSSTVSETGNDEDVTTTGSIEKHSTEQIPSQGSASENTTTPSEIQLNGENDSSTQNPVTDQSITTTIQSLLGDIVDIFNALTTTTSPEGNISNIPQDELQATTLTSKVDLDEGTTLSATNEESATKVPTTASGDMSDREHVSTTSAEEVQQTTTVSSSQKDINFSDFPTEEHYSINELPTARKVATPSVGQSDNTSPNGLTNDDGTLKLTTVMSGSSENKVPEAVPTTERTALESDDSTDVGNMVTTANPDQEEVTAGTLKIIEIPATTPMPKITTTTMTSHNSDDETTTGQFSTSDGSLLDDIASPTDVATHDGKTESSTLNPQTTASSHGLTPDKTDKDINSETTVGSTLENVPDAMSLTTTSVPHKQTSDDATDIPMLHDRGEVILSTTKFSYEKTTFKGISEESSSKHITSTSSSDIPIPATMRNTMRDEQSPSTEPSFRSTTMASDSEDKDSDNEDINFSTINPSVLEIRQEEQTAASLLKGEDDSTTVTESSVPNVPILETGVPNVSSSGIDTTTVSDSTGPHIPSRVAEATTVTITGVPNVSSSEMESTTPNVSGSDIEATTIPDSRVTSVSSLQTGTTAATDSSTTNASDSEIETTTIMDSNATNVPSMAAEPTTLTNTGVLNVSSSEMESTTITDSSAPNVSDSEIETTTLTDLNALNVPSRVTETTTVTNTGAPYFVSSEIESTTIRDSSTPIVSEIEATTSDSSVPNASSLNTDTTDSPVRVFGSEIETTTIPDSSVPNVSNSSIETSTLENSTLLNIPSSEIETTTVSNSNVPNVSSSEMKTTTATNTGLQNVSSSEMESTTPNVSGSDIETTTITDSKVPNVSSLQTEITAETESSTTNASDSEIETTTLIDSNAPHIPSRVAETTTATNTGVPNSSSTEMESTTITDSSALNVSDSEIETTSIRDSNAPNVPRRAAETTTLTNTGVPNVSSSEMESTTITDSNAPNVSDSEIETTTLTDSNTPHVPSRAAETTTVTKTGAPNVDSSEIESTTIRDSSTPNVAEIEATTSDSSITNASNSAIEATTVADSTVLNASSSEIETTTARDSNIQNVPRLETETPSPTDATGYDENAESSTFSPQTTESDPNKQTNDVTYIPLLDYRGDVILTTTKLSYEKTTISISKESSTKHVDNTTAVGSTETTTRDDQSSSTKSSSGSTTMPAPADFDDKNPGNEEISTINPSVLEMRQEEQTPVSLLKGEDEGTLSPIESTTISKDVSDTTKPAIGLSGTTDNKEKSIESTTEADSSVPNVSSSEIGTTTMSDSSTPNVPSLEMEITTAKASSETNVTSLESQSTTVAAFSESNIPSLETESTTVTASGEANVPSLEIETTTMSGSSTPNVPSLETEITTVADSIVPTVSSLEIDTTTIKTFSESNAPSLKTESTTVKTTSEPNFSSLETESTTLTASSEPNVHEVETESTTVTAFGKTNVPNLETESANVTSSSEPNVSSLEIETTTISGSGTPNVPSLETEITTVPDSIVPTVSSLEMDTTTIKTSNEPNVTSLETENTTEKASSEPNIPSLETESTTVKASSEPNVPSLETKPTTVTASSEPNVPGVEAESTTVPFTSESHVPGVETEPTTVTVSSESSVPSLEIETTTMRYSIVPDIYSSETKSSDLEEDESTSETPELATIQRDEIRPETETTPTFSTEGFMNESSTSNDSDLKDKMATTPFDDDNSPDTTTIGTNSVTESNASTTQTTTGTLITQDDVTTTAISTDKESEGASSLKPNIEDPIMDDDITTTTTVKDTASSQDATTDNMNEDLGTTTTESQGDFINRSGETTMQTTETKLNDSSTQKPTADTTSNYDETTAYLEDASTTESEVMDSTTYKSKSKKAKNRPTTMSPDEEGEGVTTTTKKTTSSKKSNKNKMSTTPKPGGDGDTSGSDGESDSSSGQDETTTEPVPTQTTTTEESGEWVLVDDELEMTTTTPFESMPPFGPMYPMRPMSPNGQMSPFGPMQQPNDPMSPFGPMQPSNDQMSPFRPAQPPNDQMSPFGPMYPFQQRPSNESNPFQPMPFWPKPMYDHDDVNGNRSPFNDDTMSQTTTQPEPTKKPNPGWRKPPPPKKTDNSNRLLPPPAKSGSAIVGVTESIGTTISPENQSESVDYNDPTVGIELEPPAYDVEERTTFSPPDAHNLVSSKDSTTLPTLEQATVTDNGGDLSSTDGNMQDQTTTMNPQEDKLMARTAGRLVPLPIHIENEIAKVVAPELESQTSVNSISSTTQSVNLDMTTNVMGMEETTPRVTDEVMKTTMNSLTIPIVGNKEVEMGTTESPESIKKQDGTPADETTEKLDVDSTLRPDFPETTFSNFDNTTSFAQDITTTENGVLMDDINNESTTVTTSVTTEKSETPEVVDEMSTSTPISASSGDQDQTTPLEELGLKTSTLPSDSATTIMVPSDIVEMTTQQTADEESTSRTKTISNDETPSSTPKDVMKVETTTVESTTENRLQDDSRDIFAEQATARNVVTTVSPQSLIFKDEEPQTHMTTTTKTVNDTDGTDSPVIESIRTGMTTDVSMEKTTMTSLPEATTSVSPGESHDSYAATTEYPDSETISQTTAAYVSAYIIPEATTEYPDAETIPQDTSSSPNSENSQESTAADSKDDTFSETTTGNPNSGNADPVTEATTTNPGAGSSPQTTTDNLTTDDTLVFDDEQMEITSTTPGDDGLPITEITKSIRREPDTDKTVVELTHMSSKEKNRVGKTVTAVRTGSEASVSEFTTESSESTTGKHGALETQKPSTDVPNIEAKWTRFKPETTTETELTHIDAKSTTFQPETTPEVPNIDAEWTTFQPETTTEDQSIDMKSATTFQPEMSTEVPNISMKWTRFEPETTTVKAMNGESLVFDNEGDELEQTTITTEKNDTGTLMARTAGSEVRLPSGDENRPTYEESLPKLETTTMGGKDAKVLFDFEELPHSDEDVELGTTTSTPLVGKESVPTTLRSVASEGTTKSEKGDNVMFDLDGLHDSEETTVAPTGSQPTTLKSAESESTTKSEVDNVVFDLDLDGLHDSEETTVVGKDSVPTTLKPVESETTTKSQEHHVMFDLDGLHDSDEESKLETTTTSTVIPTTAKAINVEGDNVVFDLEGLHDSDEEAEKIEISTTENPKAPPKQRGKDNMNFAKPVDTVDAIEDMMDVGFEYNSTESVSTEETQHSSYLPPSTSRSIIKESTTISMQDNATKESLDLELPPVLSTESVPMNSEPVMVDDFNYNSSSSDISVNTDTETEPPTTQTYQDTTVPTALLEGFYETLFGPSGRSARVNNLGSGSYNYSVLYDTPSTTVKTTTTPEPPFEIEVKVESPNPRYLFSSDTTPEEKKLKAEISNVVNQLLLTTHKNFNLLPNFVECAGARGRTGRRKTKVLHFDTDNYPWMARIGFKEPGGVLFPCAGTIISRRYILTSAQCALRKANGTASIMEILLEGAKNAAKGMSDYEQEQYKYKVEQVLPHPNYDARTRENDLALIRLAKEIPSFNGSSDVKPICLPFEDGYGIWDSLPGEGETAYLGGWGYGLKNMAATVEEMEDAAVTIWSNENCTHLYRGDRMKKITENNICAYGKAEKDACRGDSGGPLMALMTRQRIFFQIGVVSYGPRCGYGVPGVYTKTSTYLSWILDSMQP